MQASSSKHVLTTALRRSQLCAKGQKQFADIRKFLATEYNSARCVHTGSRDRRQPMNRPQNRQHRPAWSSQYPAKPQVQQQTDRLSKITQYNMNIQEAYWAKQLRRVLELCTQMKTEGVQPDASTYKTLLRTLAEGDMYEESWAVLKDMQAMGIQPDAEVFNILLRSVNTSEKMFHILNIMSESDLVNATTYDTIIGFFVENENLDMALHKLAEMNDAGMTPALETAQRLILKAAGMGYPRLALDLALAFENSSVRRIDTETWTRLLAACSDNLYADGVQHCWDKVTKDLKASVYEGLCISVLHTAARHGLPALAASVLDTLDVLKVPLREYHLSPVLEALAANGQIKEAFTIIGLIRASGTEPSINTALTILEMIQKDPDQLDNAYSALEELVAEGQKVDIVAANVIIEAASSMNDIQRAIGVYKALDSLKLKPNLETFNTLMKVCWTCNHNELANRLIKDMAEAKVAPDTTSYRYLISSHLSQPNYEEAFYHLEDMKGRGLKPTYPTYESIIRKCISNGDSRYRLAVEELKQMGYEVRHHLRNYIDSGGEYERPPKQSKRTRK